MAYTIEQLPGESIVIVTYDSSYFDFGNDPQKIVEQIAAFAENTPERLAVIHDIRTVELKFGDIVAGMAAAFKPKKGSPVEELKTDIFVVGGPDIIQLAVRGARQAQYGGQEIMHFETLESAIQSARDRDI